MIKKLFYVLSISILLLSTSIAYAVDNNQVLFNLKTSKYHSLNCVYTRQCTKNCVLMDKDKAQKEGIPCKICHGGR